MIFLLLDIILNSTLYASEENERFISRSNFFDGKTKIERPLELRDPFRSEMKLIEVKDLAVTSYLKDGVYTNVDSSDQLPFDQFEITGILMGEKRVAIARTKDNKTITIKEGMNIGDNNGIVKAILPGGVVIVEKIVNVYGEDEYVETIIPLSMNKKNNNMAPVKQ